MSEKTLLEYEHPPAAAPSYLRAISNFDGGLKAGDTIPYIESRISGLRADLKALPSYRRVCGFKTGESLPVTYPHVLAFTVQMAVMTHANFPLRLLGLVHVRNKITQYRAIAEREAIDLKVVADGHREVHNGVEFDLLTEYVDADGETIWSETSTMLARGKSQHSGKKSSHKKAAGKDPLEFGRYATWDAPANIGRRYAACAGDYNPIHLSALSAKLFGFPRAIAHGMWLKARTAAELEGQLQTSAYSIEVQFKKPVLLPSPVMLKYNPNERGIDFALSDPSGEIARMLGNVCYL